MKALALPISISILVSFLLGFGMGIKTDLSSIFPKTKISRYDDTAIDKYDQNASSRNIATPDLKQQFPTQNSLSRSDRITSLDESHHKIQFEIELSNALTIDSSKKNTSKIINLLNRWSQDTPQLALNWLDRQKNINDLETYYSIVMQNFMQQDLTEAGQTIIYRENDAIKNHMAFNYVHHLASKEPDFAKAWILQLDDTSLQNSLKTTLIDTWVDLNPEKAIQLLSDENSMVAGDIAYSAMRAAMTLSRNDPKSFAESLYAYPDELQPHIASGLISRWIEKDKTEAFTWVSSLANGPTRDSAVEAYVDYSEFASQEDFENSFSMAESIADSATKLEIISTIIATWNDFDAETAKGALNGSTSITPEQKSMIMSCLSLL